MRNVEKHERTYEEPWCSGLTCLPVTQKIAGSNPVGSVAGKKLWDDSVTTQPVTEHPTFDSPPPKKRRATSYQRRPGPKNPNYGIPPTQWPDVICRIEQDEPLRQIAKDYNVSYQTIWRISHAARKPKEVE